MQIDDFQNEMFSEFMREQDNYGELTAIDQFAFVKVKIDERFDVLMGGQAASHSDPVLSCISNQSMKRLAFFDTRTGALYNATYELSDLSSFVRYSSLSQQRFESIVSELEQAVLEHLNEFINDPLNYDSLVAASKAADPDYKPDISESTLRELYIQGKSAEDVSNEPITAHFKIDDRNMIGAAMAYLKHPNSTANKYFKEARSEGRVLFGNYLIARDALAAEYMKMVGNISPNMVAAKNMTAALDRAFPKPKDKPNKLWLTVAKDGKEITFQYPYNTLKRNSDSRLYNLDITPLEKRHKYDELFDKSDFYAEDIARIAYRGRNVYSIPEEEYRKKTATKELEVQFYTLDDAGVEQILGPLHPRRFTRINDFNEEAAANMPPERFSFAAAKTVTVGAYSNIQAVLNDVCRQIQDHQMRRTCNLIVADGKPYMIGAWSGYYIEMPFEAKDLPKEPSEAVEPERNNDTVSLSAERKDMLAAKSALSHGDRGEEPNRGAER